VKRDNPLGTAGRNDVDFEQIYGFSAATALVRFRAWMTLLFWYMDGLSIWYMARFIES